MKLLSMNVGDSVLGKAAQESKKSNDPTKAGSASDLIANITREQWQDYLNRFQPYDRKLIDLATGNNDNEAAVERARSGVQSSFDVANGTQQRNTERLGLSTLPDEAQAIERNSKQAQTLSELNVVNNTRLHAQDRDQKLLAGSGAVSLRSIG